MWGSNVLNLLFHLVLKEVFVVCGEKCFGVLCTFHNVFTLYEHVSVKGLYIVAEEVERHKPYSFLS